jgi:Trk K+ transport system NAD-binding subunit
MRRMLKSQRRLLAMVAGLAVLLVVAALLYMIGMAHFEGEERGFWRSLEFAAETLSTTGYGADETWQSPVMVLFVVLLQFLGVFLIFLIFPVYLIPFLEERFEVRLPKEVPDLSDHVIIYRYGPGVATLLEELKSAGVETVIIEPDEPTARRLIERGFRVLHDSLDEGALKKVSLDRARSLIANSTDDEDAAVILGARQLGYQGDAVALVEEPFHRQPIMLAGATATYTPNHMLGAALAARASQRVSPRVANVQQLGQKLQVSEVRIPRGSSLVGKTLAEAGLGQRTGVSVIGQWVAGKLITPPTAGMRLEADGILVLVGSAESVQKFERVCDDAMLLRRQGPFVVAGHGEVGRKVVQLLTDVGEEVVVIDRRDAEGVTLVGDALDSRILEESGLINAQAVIMALDTDSATMFATVMAKDLAPEVPVIARVNRAENVERIHRAGADFALSISQVSGQILARRLLGEETVSIDPQLKVLRVNASGLEGKHPSQLRIREVTGCSVVAVERGEILLTDFDPDFRFETRDAIYLCGSSKATRAFLDTYPSTGEPSSSPA